MEPDLLLTEVILTSEERQSLGNIKIDWTPQPGNYIDLEGKTYAVLERHHRYKLKQGRYSLHKIAIYVQLAKRPEEQTFFDGRWVIGMQTVAIMLYQKLSAVRSIQLVLVKVANTLKSRG